MPATGSTASARSVRGHAGSSPRRPAEPAGAPLGIESVVDQVYTAIRERIAAGELTRGGRIHQEELAAALGVSRTPVREALRRLAAEGLVQMHTNRGARVADVDQSQMRAAYEARLVVEPGAARLAAAADPHQRKPWLRRMERALGAQRRAIGSVRTSFAANREFHIGLVQAAGNPFLVSFVERLWVARIGEVIYERQAETPDRMRLDADEHEQILDAIVRGDGRRAETLTRHHLLEAMRRSAYLLAEPADDDAQR